jgi:hypothetical protein
MSVIARSELAQRIQGITESLECGDGGVRRDLDAALAEVDALVAANRGAVEALAKIKRVYTRTMPGPKDALRDRVLEIIAAYRSTTGGQ